MPHLPERFAPPQQEESMHTNQPARNGALERLDAFVGGWSMEASFPNAPPTGVVGRTVFEWMPGGRFLVQRWEIPRPDAPDGIAIIGSAAGPQSYVQHY